MGTRRGEEASVDGRVARRERNRDAVVKALIDLFREGQVWPSPEEVADRAGVSIRSLFRYFNDINDLTAAAMTRQQSHLAPFWALHLDPGLPLDELADTFVRARLALLTEMGLVGWVARVRATQNPALDDVLDQIRAALRQQVITAFGRSLTHVPNTKRGSIVAALDTMTSWEGYFHLTHNQGLDEAGVAEVMVESITRLLARP